MKILNEKQFKISKTLTESNGINENESIEEIVAKTILEPACDYFNSRFEKQGFKFYVKDEGDIYIMVDSDNITLNCLIDLYNKTPLFALALYRYDDKSYIASAYTLSEMCDLLDDVLVTLPEI